MAHLYIDPTVPVCKCAQGQCCAPHLPPFVSATYGQNGKTETRPKAAAFNVESCVPYDLNFGRSHHLPNNGPRENQELVLTNWESPWLWQTPMVRKRLRYHEQ